MHLLMVSCRKVSAATDFAPLSYHRVLPNAKQPEQVSHAEFLKLAGAKPYLMVHGFRQQVDDVIEHFQDVAEKLLWVNGDEQYTSAIMFTWPSGVDVWFPITSWVSFKRAQARVGQAATYLVELLRLLPKTALYGHSLGCAVILQACKSLDDGYFHFVVLAGAACPADWLNAVIYRSKIWAVLYSRKDTTLKYLYTVTNWRKKALGYVGPVDLSVQAVQMHCKHSDYHKQPEFPPLLTWG